MLDLACLQFVHYKDQFRLLELLNLCASFDSNCTGLMLNQPPDIVRGAPERLGVRLKIAKGVALQLRIGVDEHQSGCDLPQLLNRRGPTGTGESSDKVDCWGGPHRR